MSNIEKIKAEIDRLYDGEAPKHDQQCEFEDGYFTGIATISKFIDSLPEEKPSDDLEEEIEQIVEKYNSLANGSRVMKPSGIEKIARHFYELGKQNKEPVSEDLDEAAEKRKMGITPIGIIRMKVQELKWADVDKAGDLDIHPLEKEKYNYAIKQCDKIIAFIDNLPLTITKESPELNEAANDYQTTFNKTIGPFFHDDQKRAFIDGALWQARQFIKGTPNRKP